MSFDGMSAVVTGAGRGIGAAIADGLALLGTNVVVADLDSSSATSVAERISGRGHGGRAVASDMDAGSAGDHELAVAAAVEEFGRLDFYVNNAGVFQESSLEDMSVELLHRTLRVNVEGVIFGTQAAARHMRLHGGGSIVNIASIAGTKPRPNRTAYSSSKAAVLQATNSAAIELGNHRIRVNAVSPGYVDTALTQFMRDDPDLYDATVGRVPLQRMGRVDEIFSVVRFLLSEDAGYVTGANIPVDGGSRHV
ncbi:SDR family NAD(P)-dependent oxidoreductase [Gordonia terrae]